MLPEFPADWKEILKDEREKPYFHELEKFVEAERAAHTIYPAPENVFNALKFTPFENVKVFLLGQDPYHGPNQAHGLSFSVQGKVALPPSLRNIFRELKDDLNCPVSKSGDLTAWTEQGVLLLNAVLTVRAGQANSHKDRGWEQFTDAVIRAVNAKQEHVVFVLWGGYARKKTGLIDTSRHTIIQSAHPSPLSAHNGFFGSRPFSQINAALRAHGQSEIEWCLPAA